MKAKKIIKKLYMSLRIKGAAIFGEFLIIIKKFNNWKAQKVTFFLKLFFNNNLFLKNNPFISIDRL